MLCMKYDVLDMMVRISRAVPYAVKDESTACVGSRGR